MVRRLCLSLLHIFMCNYVVAQSSDRIPATFNSNYGRGINSQEHRPVKNELVNSSAVLVGEVQLCLKSRN